MRWRAAGWIIVAGLGPMLALLPILGVVVGLFDRPPAAFGVRPPTLAEAWRLSGGGELLWRTVALAVCVTGLAVPLGAWLAYAEQRLHFVGRRWLSFLALLPFAMPSYIIAATLRERIGHASFVGFWPAVMTLTVIAIPYVQLVVGAALARSNGNAEDAARTLGAGWWRVMWTVTLPRIRPAVAFSAAITGLYVIGEFGAVAVLDCHVLTWRLYRAATTAMQLPTAMMLGLSLVALAIPLVVVTTIIHGKILVPSHAETIRHTARHTASRSTTLITWGILAGVIGFGFVIPAVTLVEWVIAGVAQNLPVGDVWPAIRDTLILAVGGGVVTVVLATFSAWVAARQRSQVAAWIEPAVFAASALPGILVGFGLLQLALSVARGVDQPGIYKSLVMGGGLVFVAFATRFLAEAYGGPKATAAQVDPRQLEAAQLLGARAPRRWYRIAWPMMKPGMAAAFVIASVAIARELPITLLLATAGGFRPLSHRMYDRFSESLLLDAGVAGLILVGFAVVALVANMRWRQYAG